MFLWSILSPLNEHIQDSVSGFVSEKTHLHSTALTSTSQSCNSYVTAHISNKNHIQAHTTSQTQKSSFLLRVFLRELSLHLAADVTWLFLGS